MILIHIYVFSINGVDLNVSSFICFITASKGTVDGLGVFKSNKILTIQFLHTNGITDYYSMLCA